MNEAERELRLLRDRVLDAVNALRNRLAAITAQLRELDDTHLSPAERRALGAVDAEIDRTLDLGDTLLAAAGHEIRDKPHLPGELVPTRPAHVLVVEDDESNRGILTRTLTRLGHRVTPAADGLEAFDVLSMGGVDCIVTDFQMPHLGGGSLYQQVENRLPQYAGRFIFVTGDYTREETRAFLERTGQPVLGKPYELEELAAAVSRVLAKRTS